MKIQLLPNVFKWIGLALYVIVGIPSMIKGWAEGGSDCCEGMADTGNYPISDEAYFYTSTLSLLGIILFALAKDKIEDEYIKVLRWESVSASFVCTAILVLISLLTIGRDNIFEGALLLEIQLLLFLLFFFFKKRSAMN